MSIFSEEGHLTWMTILSSRRDVWLMMGFIVGFHCSIFSAGFEGRLVPPRLLLWSCCPNTVDICAIYLSSTGTNWIRCARTVNYASPHKRSSWGIRNGWCRHCRSFLSQTALSTPWHPDYVLHNYKKMSGAYIATDDEPYVLNPMIYVFKSEWFEWHER